MMNQQISSFSVGVSGNTNQAGLNHDPTASTLQPKKKKRNIKSPRTLQAVQNLGFQPVDMKQLQLLLINHFDNRSFDEFRMSQSEDVQDKEIMKLRHEQYVKRLNKRWKMVEAERYRISKFMLFNFAVENEDKRKKLRQSIQMTKDDITMNNNNDLKNSINYHKDSRNVNKTIDYSYNPQQYFSQDKQSIDQTFQTGIRDNQKLQTYQYNLFNHNSTQDSTIKLPISAKNLSTKQSQKKIFQILDLKIEKIKQHEEKRKQILDKLQKKMDNSALQRSMFLTEEIQAKAKRNHLEKLQQVKNHQQSIEQKSSNEFMKEMKFLQEREKSKKEYENELRKEQMLRHQEEIRKKEQLIKEKQQQEQSVQQQSQLILASIESKQSRSRQKIQEILSLKSEILKIRNSELPEKYAYVQEKLNEKERIITEKYVNNAQKRNQAFISRQQIMQQMRESSTISQSNDIDYRKQKYSILNKSVTDQPYSYDLSLHRQIEERFKKASERKGEKEREKERQVLLKRELEKMKQEEIQELKMMKSKQRQAINQQIIGKHYEKDQQIKQMKVSQEIRAQQSYKSQIRINKERDLRLRQSLNIL